jgi:hypothetical protein
VYWSYAVKIHYPILSAAKLNWDCKVNHNSHVAPRSSKYRHLHTCNTSIVHVDVTDTVLHSGGGGMDDHLPDRCCRKRQYTLL